MPRGSATILVVDDEPMICAMVCGLLEDAGYQVTEADSGDAADALIREGMELDLLLTDIRMPGTLDGVALIRRTLERCPSVKTIAMSGFAGVEYVSTQVADVFLSKPFTPSQLERDVARLLRPSTH